MGHLVGRSGKRQGHYWRPSAEGSIGLRRGVGHNSQLERERVGLHSGVGHNSELERGSVCLICGVGYSSIGAWRCCPKKKNEFVSVKVGTSY